MTYTDVDDFGITEDEWYHDEAPIPTVDEAAEILANLPRNASRALKLAIVRLARVQCSDFRTESEAANWRKEGF